MPFIHKQKSKSLKFILFAWLIFTSIYFVWAEYQRLNHYVYGQGITSGIEEAASTIIELAQKCEPFPVFVGDRSVDLVNVACLSSAISEGEMAVNEVE